MITPKKQSPNTCPPPKKNLLYSHKKKHFLCKTLHCRRVFNTAILFFIIVKLKKITRVLVCAGIYV